MGDAIRRPADATTYLVQFRKSEPGAEAWTDIDHFTAPPHMRRKTVIARVVEEIALPLEPGEAGMLRVIPLAHADPERVSYEAPAPRLRVGL